jgi:hypothetical protein
MIKYETISFVIRGQMEKEYQYVTLISLMVISFFIPADATQQECEGGFLMCLAWHNILIFVIDLFFIFHIAFGKWDYTKKIFWIAVFMIAPIGSLFLVWLEHPKVKGPVMRFLHSMKPKKGTRSGLDGFMFNSDEETSSDEENGDA